MAELMANNDKKSVQPRIAIGFFGITRSLKWTLSSIQKNIIEPARSLGDVRLYAHLYQQEYVLNPRSGEDHPMDPHEHQLLEWVLAWQLQIMSGYVLTEMLSMTMENRWQI